MIDYDDSIEGAGEGAWPTSPAFWVIRDAPHSPYSIWIFRNP